MVIETQCFSLSLKYIAMIKSNQAIDLQIQIAQMAVLGKNFKSYTKFDLCFTYMNVEAEQAQSQKASRRSIMWKFMLYKVTKIFSNMFFMDQDKDIRFLTSSQWKDSALIFSPRNVQRVKLARCHWHQATSHNQC